MPNRSYQEDPPIMKDLQQQTGENTVAETLSTMTNRCRETGIGRIHEHKGRPQDGERDSLIQEKTGPP